MMNMTIGDRVAAKWFMEQSRQAGKDGVESLDDTHIGNETDEIWCAIADAINTRCENAVKAAEGAALQAFWEGQATVTISLDFNAVRKAALADLGIKT